MSPTSPNTSDLSFDHPDDRKPCLSPRQQTPTQTTDASTSSTSFDYWWPYPLATTTTSSSSSTPSPSSSQSPTSTTIPNSSTTISSTASSSSSTTLPSQTLTSISASKSPFHIIDIIPAIAAAGIFLLGLGIWLIYGCCTRRPKIRKDDGELICGPPYSRGDYDYDDNDAGHHERRGSEIQILIHREVEHDQRMGGDEDDLVIPKRSHRGRGRGRAPGSQSRFNRHGQGHGQTHEQEYRWPSYNEPPPFDTSTGFYIPDAYKDPDGDGEYFTATLLAPPSGAGTAAAAAGGGRSNKPSRSRTNRSIASKSGLASKTTTLSPKSDCTSIALLELYESEDDDEDKDEEKDKEKHRRRATEVPWESLRHKSIKRGILEQVKKEKDKEKESRKRWMDSIKSSFTGGSGRGSMRARDEQEIVPLHHNGIEGEGEVEEQDEANRRGRSVLNAGPSGYSNELPTKQLPPSPPGQDATVRTPGGRRTFVQLKDDPQDLDKYTRIPTRNTPSHSRSRSRSRSRSQSRGGGEISSPSPTSKRRSHRANSRSRHQYRPLSLTDHEHGEPEIVLGGTGPGSISRDVLPSSPPQLMSPPLESQIFFTPPLRSTTTFNNSILSPEVRPTQNKNPTRTTTTPTTTAEKKTKSRKLHSRTPPRLPFPGSGRSRGMTSPRSDMYRGRLLKKQKSVGVRESRLDGHGNTSGDGAGGVDSECKEAMRKVDRIIKSSLSARDLVE